MAENFARGDGSGVVEKLKPDTTPYDMKSGTDDGQTTAYLTGPDGNGGAHQGLVTYDSEGTPVAFRRDRVLSEDD